MTDDSTGRLDRRRMLAATAGMAGLTGLSGCVGSLERLREAASGGDAGTGSSDGNGADGSGAGADGTAPTAKLTPPSDASSLDNFGIAVALSGDRTLIGSGDSVYVYERSGGSWRPEVPLTPRDASSLLGSKIALDGDTALVGRGSGYDGDPRGSHVFERSGGGWNQRAKLVSPDGNDLNQDAFGASVALEEETAIVSEKTDNPNHAGSASVYEPSGGSWNHQAKLVPDDGNPDDHFGHSIAFENGTLLVGAPDDDTPNGENSGSAYVFERSGGDFSQQAKLVPNDGAEDDRFGVAVALSGETALVATEGDFPAYVFERSGSSWRQQAKLAPDVDFITGMAASVAGDIAVVGTFRRGAYVFERSGGDWSQRAHLVPDTDDLQHRNGEAVALSEDGSTVLVGTHPVNRVYVYEL